MIADGDGRAQFAEVPLDPVRPVIRAVTVIMGTVVGLAFLLASAMS